MHVLQNAVGVVRYIYTEVFLIHCIPGIGQFLYCEGAADKLLFQFIAYHNVQWVGQLVRIHADKARLCLVDCPVQFLALYAGKLLREQPHKLRPEEGQKLPAASDKVFKQAALAFVYAHDAAAGKYGIPQPRRNMPLVQRMAALVDNAVHTGDHAVLIVVGGYADVLIVELRGERMLGLAQHAVIRAKAHDLHHIGGKLPLLRNGPALVQEIRPHRLAALLYFVQQRNDCIPQRSKKRISLLDVHSPFVVVKPDVIRRLFRRHVSGVPLAYLDNPLQPRRKNRKIACRLGTAPGIHAFGKCLAVLLKFPCRDIDIALTQPLQLPQLRSGLRIPAARIFCLCGIHKLAKLGAGKQTIPLHAQNTDGLAAPLPALARRCGCIVDIDQRKCVIIGVKLLFNFPNPCNGVCGFFHFYSIPPDSLNLLKPFLPLGYLQPQAQTIQCKHSISHCWPSSRRVDMAKSGNFARCKKRRIALSPKAQKPPPGISHPAEAFIYTVFIDFNLPFPYSAAAAVSPKAHRPLHKRKAPHSQ